MTGKLGDREAMPTVNRGCVPVFKTRAEPRWLTSRRREPVEESKLHVTQQRLFWQDCHWSFWRHPACCLEIRQVLFIMGEDDDADLDPAACALLGGGRGKLAPAAAAMSGPHSHVVGPCAMSQWGAPPQRTGS